MRREVFFVRLDGPAQQSLGLFDFAARVGDVTEVGDHVGVVGLKGERGVEGRRVVYSLSILFSIIKQQSTSAPRQSLSDRRHNSLHSNGCALHFFGESNPRFASSINSLFAS